MAEIKCESIDIRRKSKHLNDFHSYSVCYVVVYFLSTEKLYKVIYPAINAFELLAKYFLHSSTQVFPRI